MRVGEDSDRVVTRQRRVSGRIAAEQGLTNARQSADAMSEPDAALAIDRQRVRRALERADLLDRVGIGAEAPEMTATSCQPQHVGRGNADALNSSAVEASRLRDRKLFGDKILEVNQSGVIGRPNA